MKILSLLSLMTIFSVIAFDYEHVINFSPRMMLISQERLGMLLSSGRMLGFDHSNHAFAMFSEVSKDLEPNRYHEAFSHEIEAEALKALKAIHDADPERFEWEVALLKKDPEGQWPNFSAWLWISLLKVLKSSFNSPMTYYGLNTKSIEEFFVENHEALDPKRAGDWHIAYLSQLVCLLPRHMYELAKAGNL